MVVGMTLALTRRRRAGRARAALLRRDGPHVPSGVAVLAQRPTPYAPPKGGFRGGMWVSVAAPVGQVKVC
jgi:hypothetical protein